MKWEGEWYGKLALMLESDLVSSGGEQWAPVKGSQWYHKMVYGDNNHRGTRVSEFG